MNSRIVLLSMAVIAIGLFAMPNTLSIFSGQHTFVNGTNVECKKCHDDIYQEMIGGDDGGATVHTMGVLTDCMVCHRTGSLGLGPFGFPAARISSNKKLNITNDTKSHSAVTVECVFCHDRITQNSAGNPQEILGSNESHSAFYNATNQTDILKGGNEACVGCHTHIMINVTWQRSAGYNMTADVTGGTWNLSLSGNETLTTTYSAGQ